MQCACFEQYHKFNEVSILFIYICLNFNPIKSKAHSPLNATISSVSVLQFTEERTDSLVDGELYCFCLDIAFYDWH